MHAIRSFLDALRESLAVRIGLLFVALSVTPYYILTRILVTLQ